MTYGFPGEPARPCGFGTGNAQAHQLRRPHFHSCRRSQRLPRGIVGAGGAVRESPREIVRVEARAEDGARVYLGDGLQEVLASR
jgi:hypothetical protein